MALVRREEAKEMRSIEHGTVSKRTKAGMRNDKTPFPTASNQSNFASHHTYLSTQFILM